MSSLAKPNSASMELPSGTGCDQHHGPLQMGAIGFDRSGALSERSWFARSDVAKSWLARSFAATPRSGELASGSGRGRALQATVSNKQMVRIACADKHSRCVVHRLARSVKELAQKR